MKFQIISFKELANLLGRNSKVPYVIKQKRDSFVKFPTRKEADIALTCWIRRVDSQIPLHKTFCRKINLDRINCEVCNFSQYIRGDW